MTEKIKKKDNKLKKLNPSKKHMSKQDDPPRVFLEVTEKVSLATQISIVVMIISALIAGFGLAALLLLPGQEVQEPLVSPPTTPSTSPFPGNFATDQIIVKFKSNVADNVKQTTITNILETPMKVTVDKNTGKVIQSYSKDLLQKEQNLQPELKEIKASLKKREKIIKTITPEAAKTGLDRYELVLATTDIDVIQVVEKFQKDTNVEYAGPNYILENQLTPNDTYYSSDQWNLSKTEANLVWEIDYGAGDLDKDGHIDQDDYNILADHITHGTKPDPIELGDTNGDGISTTAADLTYLANHLSNPSAYPILGYAKNPVTVAVIDTGVDYNHEDIRDNIWQNTDEIPGNGIDDDGNGYLDDTRGWDFTTCRRWEINDFTGAYACVNPRASGDNDPRDDTADDPVYKAPDDWYAIKAFEGHGTHVAGIIAGITHNSLGIAGMAGGWNGDKPGIKIMALKAANWAGFFYASDAAEAINYASANGADVINMSWGGQANSQLINDALDTAYASGVVSVAAAGNEGGNVLYSQPANHPKVMTVSSVNNADLVNKFTTSNIGAKIDVAAPGDNILSLRALDNSGSPADFCCTGCQVDTSYCVRSGTSMAAPHVAGLIALLLMRNPSFTPDEVKSLIKMGADDILDSHEGDPAESFIGWDPYTGQGRINAYKALKISSSLIAQIDTPSNLKNYIPGDSIPVTGSAAGVNFQSYKVEYIKEQDIYPKKADGWTQISASSSKVTNGNLFNWNTNGLARGSYYLRLTVTDTSGYKLSDAKQINISYPLHPGWSNKHIINFDFSAFTFSYLNPVPPDIKILFPGEYEVYAWNHNGTDLTGWPVDTNWSNTGSAISVADLDQDRDNEVIAMTIAQIFVWQVDDFGNPSVASGWPKDHGSAAISAPAIADLDNDGDLEIVYSNNWDKRIYAYHHNGIPLTSWPFDFSGSSHPLATPALADLDNDGDKEIVVPTNNYLYVFHHNDMNSDGKPDLFSGWPKEISGGQAVSSPAIADLDNDGDLEIISASHLNNKVYAFHHNGTLVAGWPVETGGNMVSSPAIADLDGDGDLEIAVGSMDGKFYVWHHNDKNFDGKPDLVSGWPVETEGEIISSPLIADIDGNGDLEIAVGSMDGKFYVWHHDGSNFDGFPVTTTAPISSSPAVGDLEGDGSLEIGVVNQLGKIYLWDLPSSYSPDKLVWPMFHHDARHTGLYNQCRDYTQWGQCNPSTKRYCNNGKLENCPVTKPYCNPTNFTCEAKCSDGTPFGQCNASKQYCDNGNLVNNCTKCGCPSDKPYCNTSSLLCEAKCTDGTPFSQCNASKQYCDNGNLKYWCNRCTYTCPTNKPFCMTNGDCVVCRQNSDCTDSLACTNDICNSPGTASSYCSHPSNCPSTQPYCNQTSGICEAKCADGTPFGRCNGRYQYCSAGKLYNWCMSCGCPGGGICKKTSGGGTCIGGGIPVAD